MRADRAQTSMMKGLYTGLAVWNAILLAAFAVVAALQVHSAPLAPRAFQLLAVFTAVFCCLVHSLLVIHFIGSMKWIQQSGPTAGIEDTQPLRRAWIKGAMFPTLVVGMLFAVAVSIVCGGSAFAEIPAWISIGLAVASVAVNVAVIPLARKSIGANKERLVLLEDKMETRISAGEVRSEDAQILLPESGRAGGKTIMFLACNVWLLWAYNRFVLRDQHEPAWPYAVAFVALLLVGWRLSRRYDDTAGTAGRES